MHSDLQTRLPAIAISARDAGRLRHLAEVAAGQYPETSEFLAREIERAEIRAADQSMRDIVAMQSEVTFRDDIGGQARTVTLVYPEDADVAAGKISVLTPIGAALIGMQVGKSIEFQTPAGGWRSLTVIKVVQHA
ncbi:GreA/GreB family elongation factor [Afipia carboxidovorans OM5]|uniref:Transcription elongation factor GreA n=1 Tax=Afipia carboxidovorans (strain ATCC 49405 / DSM 1227 / KCTC 32145 / OM5) TaxID=504832 RepID=B6JAX8_AFIC5|nr:nucleoside diphosphate kinase regulator [Afipia carboxidovorans]ACI92052.1 GreA/GreB family elongation factor [Afipia carboxidovorans OM5]AEI04094.1 transcription elongation factor GreA [Afipia carboxidovorans OM4]AEI07724.1 transcription elongation factor GreA [Afipia carboxidovorans OM5]BEV45248.1 nucleoside diphosphate kinase regulator [Afipia carboxidovorans]